MYPGGQGQYSKMSGIGLLRLHSTYRHDLKIYASDEGRVQMTAAAFAKVLRLMLKKSVINVPISAKEISPRHIFNLLKVLWAFFCC